jgi:hypothetical protein
MQIHITLEPDQEKSHELAEVLRAFAADYDSWMIRSIKSGRHTLHDEAGDLIASLEIVKGAARERAETLAASTSDILSAV